MGRQLISLPPLFFLSTFGCNSNSVGHVEGLNIGSFAARESLFEKFTNRASSVSNYFFSFLRRLSPLLPKFVSAAAAKMRVASVKKSSQREKEIPLPAGKRGET
jgi:hypothetical protein